MTSKNEILKISALSDLSIEKSDIDSFLIQFDEIINYFDILDDVEIIRSNNECRFNIFRDDIEDESLNQKLCLQNADYSIEGYIKAPKVKL